MEARVKTQTPAAAPPAWAVTLLRSIDRGLSAVCATIVAAFTVFLIVQVALRQLGTPLFWVEELCQYLVVYLCFLGSAIAWGRREHLAVEFLPELLAPKWRAALKIFVDALVLAFAAWACYVSAEFAIFSMNKSSISMDVPVGYGYLGAPIGFGLIAFQALVFILSGGRDIKILGGAPKLEEVGM